MHNGFHHHRYKYRMDGHHRNSGFNFKPKKNATNASPTTDNNSTSDRSQEWITVFAPKTKKLPKFRHELLKQKNTISRYHKSAKEYTPKCHPSLITATILKLRHLPEEMRSLATITSNTRINEEQNIFNQLTQHIDAKFKEAYEQSKTNSETVIERLETKLETANEEIRTLQEKVASMEKHPNSSTINSTPNQVSYAQATLSNTWANGPPSSSPLPVSRPTLPYLLLHQTNPKNPTFVGKHDEPASVQKTLNDRIKHATGDNNDRVRAVEVLRSKTLKVHLAEHSNLKELQEIQWCPPNLRLHETLINLAVLRVPIPLEPEEFKEQVSRQNQSIPNQIVHARWARRDLSNKRCATMLIQVKDHETADFIKRNCLAYNGQLLYVEDAKPRIRQCRNCCRLRHTTAVCTASPKCGRCAGEHPTDKCNVPCTQRVKCTKLHMCTHITQRCANCNGDHSAFSHTCPESQQYRNQIDKDFMSAKLNITPPALSISNFPPISKHE